METVLPAPPTQPNTEDEVVADDEGIVDGEQPRTATEEMEKEN